MCDLIVFDSILHGYTNIFSWLLNLDHNSFVGLNLKNILTWSPWRKCFVNLNVYYIDIYSQKAVESGSLEILSFLFENGDPYKQDSQLSVAAAKNAKNGDLRILKFLKEKGCEGSGTRLYEYSDHNVCAGAIENGHIDVLNWVMENGYPLHRYTYEIAAKKGHLDVLMILYEKDPWLFDIRNVLSATAEGGHLHILRWMYSICGIFQYRTWGITDIAAGNGHFEALKYLHDKGFVLSISTIERATNANLPEIVKWLLSKKCQWDYRSINNVIRARDYEMLTYLLSNTREEQRASMFSTLTFAYAVENGDIGIMKLLKEYGCPFNELSCAYAAKEGRFEILQWLQDNGCPYDYRCCLYAAIVGDQPTLKLLIEKGYPIDQSLCEAVAKNGMFEILQILRARTSVEDFDVLRCVCCAENSLLSIIDDFKTDWIPNYQKNTKILTQGVGCVKILEWLGEPFKHKKFI